MNAPLEMLDDAVIDSLDIPDGYEMIDGRLVEKAMGTESGWVGGKVFARLEAYVDQQQLGWVFTAETVYRCFPRRKTARKPDVSFLRRGRLPNEQLPKGDLTLAPDLAVESVSPNDTVYELDAKVEEYLAAGVHLVWVINPEARLAVVHRPDGSMAKVREGQDLDGEDVVPGFRCPLSAVLPPVPKSNGDG